MKKIALCFSGLYRTFDECFDKVKSNIIDFNSGSCEIDLFGYLNSNDEIQIPDVGFKKCIIEKDQPHPDLSYQRERYTVVAPAEKNVYYQLYGGKRVNELRKEYEKENGFEYDYVVKIRPDVSFLTPVDFSSLEKGFLFLPNGHDHTGFNDRFAVGESKIMDIYYGRLEFWMQKHPEIPNYTTHAEKNLYAWITSNGIPVKRLNFSYALRRPGRDMHPYLIS